MKVAFRADASVAIGSGHVMRCLTLADALRERGAEVRFVCRQEPGHLGELITGRGHELVWLPSREDLHEDACDTHAALADQVPWDLLVVDHYGLDATWEGGLRSVAKKIMVIDDLADRQHDCDLLLDQNLQAPGRYAGLVPITCQALIGPKYALLRPQFAAARQERRARDGKVARILIFFGGADAGGETLKALSALEMLGRPDLAVEVVIGQVNPHRAAIEAACRAQPNVTLYCQVDDMAERMGAADLFVGAGGASSWERCYLGLPALVLATAVNQIAQAEALGRAGAQIYFGPAQSVAPERLMRMIGEMLELPELLLHMADQARSLIDGRGADRVTNCLMTAAVTLRRAVHTDSNAIFAWRNHPDTRRHALDPGEIDRETHSRWFEAVLADSDRELLIAEQEGRPIGVLRYDIEAGRGLVSIYLVPGLAGQGWGLRLLLAGERWLRDARPEVGVCEAAIAADNAASLAVFQAAGFQPYRSIFRKDLHGNG
jgi:UDP-2,4-diacetamido-2,4,6-trideoxy-beta-L-altropyranose hydrolase